ncbi:hypothetical protein [Streptomyces globisporus]|uniref:hypothetical protein n=1 Tax=Streptomyces globisporus TaxID=1908 RepID=UPI0004CA9453|nr:hypothetical protein [Streptomyces globisporus]
MNRIVFWLLVLPCAAAVAWGAAISNWDLIGLGAFAEVGVIGVNFLLIRADECEEFAEAGEEG